MISAKQQKGFDIHYHVKTVYSALCMRLKCRGRRAALLEASSEEQLLELIKDHNALFHKKVKKA